MLDIRLKTGGHFALPYAYLIAIHFDGAAEIKLSFTSHHVLIHGGNLDALYTGLLVQAVEFIQETAPPLGDRPADKLFIDGLEVKELCSAFTCFSRAKRTKPNPGPSFPPHLLRSEFLPFSVSASLFPGASHFARQRRPGHVRPRVNSLRSRTSGGEAVGTRAVAGNGPRQAKPVTFGC
jgi:hypothetical protein